MTENGKSTESKSARGNPSREGNGPRPKFASKVSSTIRRIKERDEAVAECLCSDRDFVRRVATDNTVLCKNINELQKDYNLDVADLREKAARLIHGDFRDLYEDLNPEDQIKVEVEIARLRREKTDLLMGPPKPKRGAIRKK